MKVISFAAGFLTGIAFAIWWSGYDEPEILRDPGDCA